MHESILDSNSDQNASTATSAGYRRQGSLYACGGREKDRNSLASSGWDGLFDCNALQLFHADPRYSSHEGLINKERSDFKEEYRGDGGKDGKFYCLSSGTGSLYYNDLHHGIKHRSSF